VAPRRFSGRQFGTGGHNRADLHGQVRLPVSPQAAMVFSSSEVLNVELGGPVIDHVGNDAVALNERLTDQEALVPLVEQNPVKNDAVADVGVAVIDLDDISLADSILPGSIFKNCIHGALHLGGDRRNRKFSKLGGS
jgi:hypothetical protein